MLEQGLYYCRKPMSSQSIAEENYPLVLFHSTASSENEDFHPPLEDGGIDACYILSSKRCLRVRYDFQNHFTRSFVGEAWFTLSAENNSGATESPFANTIDGRVMR